ncbi:hypothetical protein GCM10010199_12180 [Dactylosporangium roseum]
MLAVTTNLATNVVPSSWQRWTANSLLMWCAVAVLAVVVAVFAILLQHLSAAPDAPAPTQEASDKAVAELATRLEKKWAIEAVRLQVIKPVPLSVRWSSTDRPAANRSVVFDEIGADWQDLPMKGKVDPLNREIVDAFLDLPHRQLVVIGEPGAGKSIFAILLTLGLIRSAATDVGLPVIFAINEWNPATEGVEAFLARRMAEEYTDVLDGPGGPAAMARRLIEHRRVLPILDGLDELPTNLHATALIALDDFAAIGRSLVVTCRTIEYEQAVRRSQVMSRAAVIELEPVDTEAAITFLSQPVDESRWASVFGAVRQDPTGPLASAFSTPLMVGLARIAYRERSSTPSDLLTLPTRHDIAGRLMDAFVTAAYRDSPNSTAYDRRRRGRYSVDHARRALGGLAYHLYQAGTRDLHRQDLPPDLLAVHSGRTKVLIVSALALPVVAVAILCGHAIGGASMAARLAAAVAAEVAAVATLRPRLLCWLIDDHSPISLNYRTLSERRTVRRRSAFEFGLGGGLLIGLIDASWTAALLGGLFVALLGLAVDSMSMTRLTRTTLGHSIRLNGWPAVILALYSLIAGAVFGAITSFLDASARAWIAGGAAVAIFGSASVLIGIWPWACGWAARARLAVNGWMPWRLQRFLKDAHERGVLRQAGSAYQFRHVLLQDHLARTVQRKHLRAQADAGSKDAAKRLVELLAKQGRLDDLKSWADAGSPAAALQAAHMMARRGEADEAIDLLRPHADGKDVGWYFAGLLREHGRIDELRSRADAGDEPSARELAKLLGKSDDIEELRTRAELGDRNAAWEASLLLRRQERIDDAISVLAPYASDPNLGAMLARLLDQQDRVAEAIDVLRRHVDAHVPKAVRRLADLLAEHGRTDEAVEVLQAHGSAAFVADLLRAHGNIDQLQALAAAGDERAAIELAELHIERNLLEEAAAVLRTSAESGSRSAARKLADLLSKRGQSEELRARSEAGDKFAESALNKLLADRADLVGLRSRADAGDSEAARSLARLLAQRGSIDEAIDALRSHTSHAEAARDLVNLLRQRSRIDELRHRADAGDHNASGALASLLEQRGELEELRRRAHAGDGAAAAGLAHLLRERGDIEELQTRTRAGDTFAANSLVRALEAHGRVDEAVEVLRKGALAGDKDSVKLLIDLLVRNDRRNEAAAFLRPRADAGDRDAARRLSDLTNPDDGWG